MGAIQLITNSATPDAQPMAMDHRRRKGLKGCDTDARAVRMFAEDAVLAWITGNEGSE